VVGADCLTENGHMTYSEDGRWLLSDTYPDSLSNERLLILYDTRTAQRYDVGSFYTDPDLGKPNRCDLHPRWSPDARLVCIDSVHEHARQIYLVDVSELTGGGD
jgi:Tol biopolymer transport system component